MKNNGDFLEYQSRLREEIESILGINRNEWVLGTPLSGCKVMRDEQFWAAFARAVELEKSGDL